jgi:CHAT domain-containing protein
LIQPAAAQLAGRSRLVIVRDAGLWELPFQALKNGAGRYLLEEFAVSYAPSLTALAEMGRARRARPASELALLAFGAPRFGEPSAADDARFASLPGAEQELRQLARIHGEARSRIYLGAEAREERLKAEAGTAGIVHLATHGVLDDANPMYSRIVLAQPEAKSGEDGLLQPWEVMKLDLRADLVVLSACETGRGRIGAGEGLIGLTWAFFVAGAPTTVVSQWKVDAARTSQLMLAFHRRLRMASISKAEALRQAELTLLRNPQYRHPFYWAGFSILGVAN